MAKSFLPTDVNFANFWAKVEIGDPEDCWIWTGAKVNGYGTFTVNNRTFLAHHVSLILTGRPRPDEPRHMGLHGRCSNPMCVNPAHLRWGSQQENIADKYRLGRNDDRSGENSPVCKITDEQVAAIRSDNRPSTHVAPEYGVTPSHIRHIRRGVTRVAKAS